VLNLFGEQSLKRALQQYLVHYHEEGNHQGKENQRLFPSQAQRTNGGQGAARSQERSGGLLKYYQEEAA
jgi:putative transposase